MVPKTGIQNRYYLSDGASLDELAAVAAMGAIRNSSLTVDDVDAIICTTSTPLQSIPATASLIARNIGVKRHIPAFDINAVCSGWSYGLAVAQSFLFSDSTIENFLVVSADSYSRIMDQEDPTTVTLFGDGAAASILSTNNSGTRFGHLLEKVLMRNVADAADAVKTEPNLLETMQSGSSVQRPHFKMNGRQVIEIAKLVSESDREFVFDCVARHGMKILLTSRHTRKVVQRNQDDEDFS